MTGLYQENRPGQSRVQTDMIDLKMIKRCKKQMRLFFQPMLILFKWIKNAEKCNWIATTKAVSLNF